MKFKNLSVFILALSLLASGAHADNIAVDAVRASSDTATPDIFRAVVTGDGKLTLNPGPVFTEGGEYEGVQMPYLISHSNSIKYPRWALRQGWQGEFSIAIEVKLDGSVGRYKVMKSTGHESLDEAATKAVLTWKFQPAMKNGKPFLTCIQIPVRFQIDQKA